MRVTNNMIIKNSAYNIGGTKQAVNAGNTQMTTQNKISRPSEDPVVAIRSLRLGTSLSKINQYYEKNIPDAKSWLESTESALLNMKEIVTDLRTQCVNGATDTLTQDDRNTIISQLKQLQKKMYSEANADYAGRTVFTGFRTDSTMTFMDNETETKYNINQEFTTDDIEEYRYYNDLLEVPTTENEVLNNNIANLQETTYTRIRTSYNQLDGVDELSYSYKAKNGTDTDVIFDIANATSKTEKNADGAEYTYQTATSNTDNKTLLVFDNADDWAAMKGTKDVGEDEIVFLKSTGEMILGSKVSSEMKSNDAKIHLNYDKTGFDKGELRPEYYYNCTDVTDALNPVEYTKYDKDGNVISYDINYTIAPNQQLAVNMEGSDVFDASLLRDVNEMISAVDFAKAAHDKVSTIKNMMGQAAYATDEDQEKLEVWLARAQKEADYADSNMQKLFNTQLGKVDDYMGQLTLQITKLGCTTEQLELTENRMNDQQETIEQLKSDNDNLDLSQIIIDYTASYTAYQSSLQAAAQVGKMSLLNYL